MNMYRGECEEVDRKDLTEARVCVEPFDDDVEDRLWLQKERKLGYDGFKPEVEAVAGRAGVDFARVL